jgi:hypothetical protein
VSWPNRGRVGGEVGCFLATAAGFGPRGGRGTVVGVRSSGCGGPTLMRVQLYADKDAAAARRTWTGGWTACQRYLWRDPRAGGATRRSVWWLKARCAWSLGDQFGRNRWMHTRMASLYMDFCYMRFSWHANDYQNSYCFVYSSACLWHALLSSKIL